MICARPLSCRFLSNSAKHTEKMIPTSKTDEHMLAAGYFTEVKQVGQRTLK